MLLCILFIQHAKGQKNWKMQRVQLQTRWAKNVSPSHTHNEYPRPQLVRGRWVNLNGLWDYAIVKKQAANAKPSAYQGQILVPYPIESALSGIKKQLLPDEYLLYKREFIRPDIKQGEKLLLHFGAVDWQATVFVNGKEAGEHTGGYTAFTFDVTSLLKEGKNELMVKVYDPSDQGIGPHGKQVLNPANIYYTSSSGIWQTVWLETVPEEYIERLKISPDVDRGEVLIDVKGPTTAAVDIKVFDGKKEIASSHAPRNDGKITLKIPKAKLWSPDDPFLYDMEVSMGKDKVKSYFGMRKISIGKDEKGIDRIMLNNKYTYNLGTLDQGFWPDGLYTAPTDQALQFDIKAIKAMGFNTIRKHIKVEAARWYYYADKLGIMVWQDMVNPNQGLPAGAKEEFEKESKEIVEQLHNYPSITTWVLFNEKWGQYDQPRLTKWLKDADPSRIVNGHSGEYLYVNKELRSPSPDAYIGADMTDVHSYPDPMMPEQQKGKAWVCGEFGGIGVPVPYHQWNDLTGWGYVQVKPADLITKYSGMVDKLVELEKQGLSASIYTQPFDVEGEENGLMTYDREVIKIPVDRLREIHGRLINLNTTGFKTDLSFQIGKDLDPTDTDERYPELVAEFEKGKRDSLFLRRLLLVAGRLKDHNGSKKLTEAYVKQLKNIYTTENISFISSITRTGEDYGFYLFKTDGAKINQIMGANYAESKMISIISQEDIIPYSKRENVDWMKIQNNVIQKYGEIGKEALYGHMMAYFVGKEDWKQFAQYYSLYFDKASGRSFLDVNNLSWLVFQHVLDREIIQKALDVIKDEIDKSVSPDSDTLDTYANLLYKNGRKLEAIEWEKKALKLDPTSKWKNEALKKMQRGEETW